MIRVEIVNVFLTAKGDEFLVLLRGPTDERTLPISIGQLEAQSIAIKIFNVSFPRPLTHDLFKTVLEQSGIAVTKVVISDLIDSTFFARLFIEQGGRTVEIDSRPSDAVALAVRFAAPIFVEEKVMDEAGVVLPHDTEKSLAENAPAEKLSPIEEARKQLQNAIMEERYEDAARLRDDINKLSKSN